jgi:acetyl-CoA carboxylase carboxyltransferase component
MKMQHAYASAVKYGCPLVTVWNSKGGEIAEPHDLIEAYSGIIEDSAKLSGVVPLVSVVTGQCSGLNAALCRMSDFVIATEAAEVFITPPFLGGSTEDIADITVKTADEALSAARELLLVLPPNNLESAMHAPGADIILSEVTAFGALGGTTVGRITLGETLTSADAAIIMNFVSFCDAFSLPVITTIDNDGISPCLNTHDTARLAQVYASSATPKIAVITARACGSAFILASGFRNDFVLAYEGAVISPVPVKTAAAFLEMSEPDYIRDYANAELALGKGFIDEIIAPYEVPEALEKALNIARNKRIAFHPRKKGCIT